MKLYTPAFAALFCANLTMVSSYACFFLYPLLINQQGGNNQDIGLIMGAFAMASALSRPWVAEMIDRIGPKRSYSIGAVIMTLFPLCYLGLQGELARIYPLLLLVRVIHGIGLAIAFTAVFTFIIDLIPLARLNEGIGIFGTSGLIGLAIGPLIAEPIFKHYGTTGYFITAFLLAATAMLLHLPVKDRYQGSQQPSISSPSFFSLLKSRKQLICGSLALLFGIGLAASGNFIAPFAHERALDYFSLYYLAYSVAAVGIRIVAGRLADRVGERQIVPWGIIFAGLALMAVPWINSKVALLAVGFIFGSGHGLLFPSLNAMAIRHEPAHVRGKITGIFTGGIDTGAFLGAMLLGGIGQQLGFTALFICAGFAMLSGLLILRLQTQS